MPLRRIDRGRPPEQTDTLFTGVERVYDPKRLWCNERGGEERDCGAKREVVSKATTIRRGTRDGGTSR